MTQHSGKRGKGPAMTGRIKTTPYRVRSGDRVRLDRRATDDDGGLDRRETRQRFKTMSRRLVDLQELLYAEGRHALLVVFQAMDAGGKDSTIRHVFGPVNPQGCQVTGFRTPAGSELGHDYLWRIHQHVPARGMIGVFNRSHYEDVLIARVRKLVPSETWQKRYDHINAFERMLADEGVTILKFFLHIGSDYQKQRLQRRLDSPDKQWKFDPADLVSRAQWADYQRAYEDAMQRCSTARAPWYVVPAENRDFRDLLVAQVVVDALEGLKMKYPKPAYDPATVRIE